MEVLTGQDVRDAREFLGISQRELARGADVARHFLSFFEQGKMVPTEAYLKKVRDYLADQGIDLPPISVDGLQERLFQPSSGTKPARVQAYADNNGVEPGLDPGQEPAPASSARVLQGIVVADSVSDVRAASLVDELGVIEDQIATLINEPMEFDGLLCRTVFSDPTDDAVSLQRQLRLAMARAYCLVREIQGGDAVQPCSEVIGNFEEGGDAGSQGGWLSQAFGDVFGFLDSEDDPDGPADRTDLNWAGLGRRRIRERCPFADDRADSQADL